MPATEWPNKQLPRKENGVPERIVDLRKGMKKDRFWKWLFDWVAVFIQDGLLTSHSVLERTLKTPLTMILIENNFYLRRHILVGGISWFDLLKCCFQFEINDL